MPPKRSTRRAGLTASATPRRASTRATRQARTPTPQADPEPTPEPEPEQEPSEDEAVASQPQTDDDRQPPQEDGDEDEEGEEDGAQGQTEGDNASEASDQAIEKSRRKPGRPPRVRPLGWDTADPEGNDASESGTPARRGRGRGRGGWRGGPRGRGKRGGGIPVTKPPTDENGNELPVIEDEVVHPTHSEGEKKVDENGVLQGGREYRVRTFTIIGRKQRLYMLSTEPARCIGFRDSYLFFNKHKYLYKIIIGEAEKKDLIERDILPHSYKGRSIGVVTARSVYRQFGAKIVVGGKKIIDDYNPDEARARGDVEGELADPYDRMPDKGQGYNRNQYVAWHGASSVYHTNAPMGPAVVGSLAGKKRGAITSANWMYEHAREASRFNSTLAAARKQAQAGVYDPHTNLVCFPKVTQPTHAVWEAVEEPVSSPALRKRKVEVNGHTPALTNGDHADVEMEDATDVPKPTALPKPSPYLTRNYLTVDTELLTPHHASWAPPDYRIRPSPVSDAATGAPSADPDHDSNSIADAGLWPQGLPPVSSDILATFPPDAREAYHRERALQGAWQGLWSGSGSDAVRRPKIGIANIGPGG